MTSVSWLSANSGNWSTATDWSNGLVPNSASAVILGLSGAYTVTVDSSAAQTAASLNIINSAVTLDIDQSLAIAGTFTIGDAAVAVQTGGTLQAKSTTIDDGTLSLSSGSIVQNGTLNNLNGDVSSIGGTFSKVRFEGTLDLTEAGSSLTLINGTTFAGPSGVGAGTINMTTNSSTGSVLNVQGTNTLDNATLNIGDNYNWFGTLGYDYLVNQDVTGKGAVLTLGANLAIDQTGAYAQITSSNLKGDAIINDGVINATYSGGILQINPGSSNKFTNNGTINVGAGDSVDITNLVNPGIVNLTGGILDLYGTVTASLIDSLNLAGGVVQITDIVSGGTITAPNGGVGGNGGTLSGVTFQGTLDLTEAGSSLTLTKGTTFAGAGGVGSGTINMAGASSAGSTLNVQGTNTLDNATLNIGDNYNWFGTLGYDYLVNQDITGKGAVLTLGANLAIDQTGAYAQITSSNLKGDAIINDGTINATYSGGILQINPGSSNKFTNNGIINIGSGDSVDITNLVNSGIVSLTGGILDLYGTVTTNLIDSLNLAGGVVQITDMVSGGTITAPNGGVGGNGGTLSGVTFQGTLDLTAAGSSLTLTKGTTFAGPSGVGAGTINMTTNSSTGSVLNVQGTNTLDNATLNIGDNYNWFGTLGYDYLVNQDVTGKGAVLTLGVNLVIDQTGAYVQITSSNLYGDNIINDGTINADYAGGSFIISAAYFTNSGTISVSNGDTLDIASTYFGSSNSTFSSGTLTVAAGSTLEFTSKTAINSLATTVTLSGANSSLLQLLNGAWTSFDSTLTAIAATGTLELEQGRNFTVGKAFSISGALDLSASNFTANSISIGATGSLFGNGVVTGTVANAGRIEANGGTLTLASATSGNGTAKIDAGATLELGAASSTNVAFNGVGALQIDAPSLYTGTVSGLVAGDTIDLQGVANAASVAINGSDLVVSLKGGGTLEIATSGNLSNLGFTVAQDSSGKDSVITANAASSPHHSIPTHSVTPQSKEGMQAAALHLLIQYMAAGFSEPAKPSAFSLAPDGHAGWGDHHMPLLAATHR